MESPAHIELNDFIATLGAAATIHECESAMTGALKRLGFDRFAYAGGHLRRGLDPDARMFAGQPICATHFDPEWAAHYRREHYFDDDPVVRACLNSSTPFIWCDRSRVPITSPRQTKIMEEASEFHLILGFSIPAHGYKGEFGILSATSSESEAEFRKIVGAYGHIVHLAALYYHSTLLKKWPPEIALTQGKKLTAREVEVLQWVALGKTSWEISVILNISERTVKTHLEHLTSKLNVRTRTYAVAKALTLGLIEL